MIHARKKMIIITATKLKRELILTILILILILVILRNIQIYKNLSVETLIFSKIMILFRIQTINLNILKMMTKLKWMQFTQTLQIKPSKNEIKSNFILFINQLIHNGFVLKINIINLINFLFIFLKCIFYFILFFYLLLVIKTFSSINWIRIC